MYRQYLSEAKALTFNPRQGQKDFYFLPIYKKGMRLGLKTISMLLVGDLLLIVIRNICNLHPTVVLQRVVFWERCITGPWGVQQTLKHRHCFVERKKKSCSDPKLLCICNISFYKWKKIQSVLSFFQFLLQAAILAGLWKWWGSRHFRERKLIPFVDCSFLNKPVYQKTYE